jgi:hypothetical protein
MTAAGCVFDPSVPSARIICKTDQECPVRYTCEPIEEASIPVSICCKERGCAGRISAAEKGRIEVAAATGGGSTDGPVSEDGPTGCGNGRMDPGETCDPPSSCPQSCPQQGCETFTMMGSPSQCNARCVSTGQQMACMTGDKCCPAGCTTGNDEDCNCTCGNSMVETACGETCDPLASCPTTCAPNGCMLRRLADSGPCRATCVNDQLQTACVSGDNCCPASCSAADDKDCLASCGNAAVEPGETCDPPGSCPTTCPAIGCTLRKLEGSAALCTAKCVDAGPQTACAAGDSCCPASCTLATDADCSCTCGNSMVETSCGETCDPVSSCPTTCPPMGCQLRKLANGGGCQAQCVNDRLQTECMGGDGCCPPMCNANNDSDCAVKCGNGAVETGETCDPASSCPATCPWMGCARRKLSGMALSCTATCVADGTQTACAHGDGCCPPTCNATNDNDCTARCGNDVVEAGEKCDGNCPTTCPNVGCQRRKLQGTGCNAECVNDTLITTCTASDGCCASGCTSVNDNDCSCQCGNGVVEPACGEKCEGNCPTTCPAVGCQLRTLQNGSMPCKAECVNGATITTCTNGDSCCPGTCNATNDNNCTAVCGNMVVEAGEKCDPPSMCQSQSDACVSTKDTIKTRTGVVASCTFQCNSMPRPCLAASDGQCPSACSPCAASCGTNQDIDCKFNNGDTCTSNNQCPVACTDGRCCAGTGTCMTCYACTGTSGSCVFIGANMDDTVPAGACTGVNSCDGAGTCKKELGQSCTANTQCLSGNCVDGYCCNTSCNNPCDRCNGVVLGTCVAAVVGSAPSPSCGTPYNCNGSSFGCPPSTCNSSNNCMSGYSCRNNTCQTCEFAGEVCGTDAACCSGNCFNFACQ